MSDDNHSMKLKIEINTVEHYSLFDLVQHDFTMNSDWFSGAASLSTYHIDELMGTKLRALYQRRKGRDLFDLWVVLEKSMIDCDRVLNVFDFYNKQDDIRITRANFEKNMFEKSKHDDFKQDIEQLIAPEIIWDYRRASQLVSERLIEILPGDPWVGK